MFPLIPLGIVAVGKGLTALGIGLGLMKACKVVSTVAIATKTVSTVKIIVSGSLLAIEGYRAFVEDVETPAMEKGYARASKKYKTIGNELKNKISEEQGNRKKTKNYYTQATGKLVIYLKSLEAKENSLNKKLDKTNIGGSNTSWSHIANYVPNKGASITGGANGLSIASFGGFALEVATGIGILAFFENHRSAKITKSELAGYMQAKEKFLKIIEKLSKDLKMICDKASDEEKEYRELYNLTLIKITNKETLIAEKELLLEMDN